MSRLRVGLLFGGRSVEHEVSIASATSILGALDQERYDVSLIGIDPDGRWHLGGPGERLEAVLEAQEVVLPGTPGEASLLSAENGSAAAQLDVIFPIVHGRGGEDGSVQGLFELAGIAYVGSGVLSSSLQMDKDFSKRLLAAAGLPVVPWRTVQGADLDPAKFDEIARSSIEELGERLFVKPANSGSSVGIHLAEDFAELVSVIEDAARYDTKVLIEQAVDAREIEVAVLGNESPEASVPGELRSHGRFYDYESKYEDDSTELIIPAELPEDESKRIRDLAVHAYRVHDAAGLARVDFLMRRSDGEVFINELNSLPGFTNVSMYPQLWGATGVPYPQLLDRLIELALDRHARRSRLVTSR